MANIGIHVKLDSRSSLDNAIAADHKNYGLRVAQIFTHGPRSMVKNSYDSEAIRDYCSEHNITLIVHSSYFLTPWKDDKYQIKSVVTELLDAYETGARHLILHLPAKLKHSEAIKIIRKISTKVGALNTKKRAKATAVMLVLEHKAHKPYKDRNHNLSYTDSLSLQSFMASLDTAGFGPNSKPLGVGICLDTAHMFLSNSLQGFSDEEEMTEYLDDLTDNIDMIRVVHFNGAYNGHGSGKDKHTIPFSHQDKIWKDDNTGAITLINTLRNHNPDIPFVIEWNLGTNESMKRCFRKLTNLGLF